MLTFLHSKLKSNTKNILSPTLLGVTLDTQCTVPYKPVWCCGAGADFLVCRSRGWIY